ncbi:hypothetical protein BN7_4139 [Wickerhamomyces ciferrii]|uniref:SPIN90/Ldb17 leucine-rich domain-containing protein n=1 Tax=Wickerhamomyces ciferrii (strain ATCC 14091 / BCRC 22168 / CBS 111 / JCM 3599 / NBRC 0793 / NRRL Y-1031 F-60-10) TaxID=1206466 RepID=K0KTF9_WICCF|nr:uncharacterized protein BN7_4139 [Wickerhamomyces ciferrii]CCH44573.1 hypothetical protein BN7_4139 [Wickerhamomyces ciferrii]
METDQIFQESTLFWGHLKELLKCPEVEDYELANTRLVQYIKTVSDHVHIYITEDHDLYQCGIGLISSPIYEIHREFCISKMLSFLNIDLLEQNFKLFVSYVLLLDCKNDASILQLVQDYQGFNVLYKNLHQNFENVALLSKKEGDSITIGVIKRICTIQLDLMFQMCKYLSITQEELTIIDTFFINYIFESLIVVDSEEDLFNFAKFKIILAVNEQFMIVSRESKIENKVFHTIATHTTFRNFSECLLVYFNREEDRCLQIMISKVLYLIFTNSSTKELFYHNDLNVLVDVLLRELRNLSEEEESIRNTFLRVLYPLLKCSQFEDTNYKKDKLKKLLNYFAGQSESTFWHQTETTKRLALRCLSINWLTREEDQDSEPSPSPPKKDTLTVPEINHSNTSINSISKRQPPPAPLPRKLLSRNSSYHNTSNDTHTNNNNRNNGKIMPPSIR